MKGLAIINCSCAFHFIEQCALPKLLAVLVGEWKAIRFISHMRNDHLLVVADNGQANQISVIRIIVSRTGAQ